MISFDHEPGAGQQDGDNLVTGDSVDAEGHARMALGKAARYIFLLLFLCYKVEIKQYFSLIFSQELTDTNTPRTPHAREKRQSESTSSQQEVLLFNDTSEFEVQVGINSSDLDKVEEILGNLKFPVFLSETGEILSIVITTDCSSVSDFGYQCTCREGFAWPQDRCGVDVCGSPGDDLCRCRTTIPSDGQFCQSVASLTEPVNFEIIVEVRVAASSVAQITAALPDTAVALPLTRSVNLTDVDLTTVCTPEPELQHCECENGFAYPSDKCEPRPCSNVTCNICTCIYGRPDDVIFCEPIEDVAQCINTTTSPETSTTSHVTLTTSPETSTTSHVTFIASPETSTTSHVTLTTSPETSTTSHVTFIASPEASTTSHVTLTISPEASTTSHVTLTTSPETSTTSHVTLTTSPETSTTSHVTFIASPEASTTSHVTFIASPETSTSSSMTSSSTSARPPQIETVEVTLDREFDESFNDEQADTINSIIEREAREHIANVMEITPAAFRSGSTIISFNVIAPRISEEDLRVLQNELFNSLSRLFPVIFDSLDPINRQPPEIFFRDSVTLTCGPPPSSLNFGTTESVEWTRNGMTLPDDTEMLFFANILPTDGGMYECRLKNENGSTFRQRAAVTVLDEPVLHIEPIRRIVSCDGGAVPVECFVEGNHNISFRERNEGPAQRITFDIEIPEDCGESNQTFTCALSPSGQFSKTITLTFTRSNIVCDDQRFGQAVLNYRAAVTCQNGSEGEVTAVCRESTEFEDIQDNCVLAAIQRLLEWSELLGSTTLAVFLDELSNVTTELASEVVESQANIIAIVRILNNVARVALTTELNGTLIEDVLQTVDILTRDDARETWESLFEVAIDPSQSALDGETSFQERMSKMSAFMQKFFTTKMSQTLSVSSLLLQSLETITTRVINETLAINTALILFNKGRGTGSFNIDSDAVEIDIPEAGGFITSITFLSMDNVLPPRDEANTSSRFINARVVLVQSTDTVDNISFAYDRLNQSLANPQCVFWNFDLFDGLGGWDDEGCEFVLRVDNIFTCSCDHLTSFSMLMSIGNPDSPFLVFITYIGIGISLASLVICLIIEAIVWRKIANNRTSYLRHVSIVNIAVSLLIADIWLIVAFNVSEQTNVPVCIAATFFVHFFYLALFFWMFASALLLLYRIISIFDSNLSKSSMLAIGFCVGYGAPIVIAAITIAVTLPGNVYIRRAGGCWLNWVQSRALLAFVIPALLIVLINFIILIIVVYKIFRSQTAGGNATQENERHVIVVIMRSLAILTPLLGLTWALGVGTLFDQTNQGIHIAFSFFNSLQGFFVLVFGTLMDKKVRSELVSISTSTTGTRNSSGGFTSGLGIFRIFRQNRDGYHASSS